MIHSGRVSLHPTVFVAPGGVLLGDVTLGQHSSVWFNTVIRGDSAPVVVGDYTNIQDNSVVHEDEDLPTHIGSRVTIGHRAIVHGCVIESECLIGMGAVILSGARIGKGSLIGASSLVRENQVIPPDSLVVGSPAKVLGTASPKHRDAIRNGAYHYHELALSYMMAGLAHGADPLGQVVAHEAPMTTREWRALIERLDEEPGAWSAAPENPALRDALNDLGARDTFRVRVIEHLLAEMLPLPVISAPPPQIRDAAPAAEALETWRTTRRALVASLRPFSRKEWIRPIGHPTRGARRLGDWVREWVEEDLERRVAHSTAGENRS